MFVVPGFSVLVGVGDVGCWMVGGISYPRTVRVLLIFGMEFGAFALVTDFFLSAQAVGFAVVSTTVAFAIVAAVASAVVTATA